MSTEWIAIAVIKRPVGLEGFCAVEPFGETFVSLAPPCTVRIGREIGSATDVELSEIMPLPKEYRCRFSGKNDRDAVEGLRGMLVFVDNEALPRRNDREFYHFELVGMEVFADEGSGRIGIVAEVYNYPSADTIEVKRERAESVMVPLSEQAIVSIDRAAKRITVRRTFIEELLS